MTTTSSVPYDNGPTLGPFRLVQKLFYQRMLLVMVVVVMPVDVSVPMHITGFGDSWGNKRNRD